MEFAFTEREEMLRKAVREFAESEIPPKMEKMEETGEFPVELMKPMAQVGITGIITPPEFGGVGMGYLARNIVLEELGRVCAAFPMSMQVHHMACAALSDFGTDEQKKKYLPPLAAGETFGTVGVTDPAGGSDVIGMKCTAELKGDKYVINGRKCFITNSHLSDFWIMVAKTGEGAKGLSAFIIDKGTPGAKLGRKENKFGLRGANTGEWVFDNCEVSKENLLGAEGQGLTVGLKTISETGRTGMAAVGLGILQAVYEEAGKFANERVLYGKPIATLQAIQFHMAEIYTQLDICRMLNYRVNWMKDQNMRCDTETSMAKYYTCNAAVEAAKKAIEIHGSYGIMREYAIQRLFRDAMVTVPAGGTAEVAKAGIGRAALAPFKK